MSNQLPDDQRKMPQKRAEATNQQSLPAVQGPVFDPMMVKLQAQYFVSCGLSLSVVLEMMGAGLPGIGLAVGVSAAAAYWARDIHDVMSPGIDAARALFSLLTHRDGGEMTPGEGRMMSRYASKEWWLYGKVPVNYSPTRPEIAEDINTEEPEDEAPKVIIKRGKNGYLNMAPDYQPHVNSILGHCVLCVGLRGSGKSSAAARLVEQLGQYKIPFLVVDYKLDYVTLPDVLERCMNAGSPDWKQQSDYNDGGYWGLTKENAYDAGWTILENGVRIIFQRMSYKTINEAAEVLLGIIEGMNAWANARPAGSRIPALILLDEAQQYLPEGQNVSSIDPDLSIRLLEAFEQLNSIGRSLGFTPAFFTQRPAQIKKAVIGGSEIFWLMKQSIKQDLDLYDETVGKDVLRDANITRQVIQSFKSGEAMVYENGELLLTRFFERQSEHLSITPSLEDAEAFYKSKRFTASLIDAKKALSHSPEPTYRSVDEFVSSSDPLPRESVRENVRALEEPLEDRKSPVSPHQVSESLEEQNAPGFTPSDVIAVLNAYADLIKRNEPVGRQKILDCLRQVDKDNWNQRKYPIIQAVCNAFDICPVKDKG